MSFHAITLDVTDALPQSMSADGPLTIAAWLFMPPVLPTRPAVIALLNGGTYDKRYFHVPLPGYSMAEHLCDHGHIVVLLDHLGIGESSRAPDQMQVTRQVAAAANHAAMTKVYAGLRNGSLVPGHGALPDFVRVGGGHSMGGMQTITQQAAHRSYDAILVLGYTGFGVHLTIGGQLISADPGPLDFTQPGYSVRDRRVLQATFHWDDVPADVIAADDALNVEVPYILSTQAISAGIVADDAGIIDVPLYICLGERDVSPNPHGEPSCYPGSRDITLHILERSGHCQNFASTRYTMWDRINRWVDGL